MNLPDCMVNIINELVRIHVASSHVNGPIAFDEVIAMVVVTPSELIYPAIPDQGCENGSCGTEKNNNKHKTSLIQKAVERLLNESDQ